LISQQHVYQVHLTRVIGVPRSPRGRFFHGTPQLQVIASEEASLGKRYVESQRVTEQRAEEKLTERKAAKLTIAHRQQGEALSRLLN